MTSTSPGSRVPDPDDVEGWAAVGDDTEIVGVLTPQAQEAVEQIPWPTREELLTMATRAEVRKRLEMVVMAKFRVAAETRRAWQVNWYAPRERGRRFAPVDVEQAREWERDFLGARPSGGQRLEDHDGAPGGAAAGPSPRINVRVPLWLHERLVDEAVRQQRKVAALVRDALMEQYGDGW